MKDISKRRAMAGKVALAAAVVIALPLTATVIPVAAQQGAEQGETKIEKRVERRVEMGDGAHVQTIERGDTTYVFKSDSPLSEDEIKTKIAEADADMARADADADKAAADADRAANEADWAASEADKAASDARWAADDAGMVAPPRPPAPPATPAQGSNVNGEQQISRQVTVRRQGDGTEQRVEVNAPPRAPVACASGSRRMMSERETTGADGVRRRTMMVSCNPNGDDAQLLAGLKKRRANLVGSDKYRKNPADYADAVAFLDEQIAKLEAERR